MALRARGVAFFLCAFVAAPTSVAAKPHAACPPGTSPDWAQMSDSGGDFYPVGQSLPPGAVTLSCVAGADGRLYDCQVAQETPENQGLGLWALHVARDFRLKRPGCPPDGVRFAIPLRFERSG